jgi:hypothetical protein
MPENIPPAPAQPEIPSLSSIQDFLFGAALYAQYTFSKDTAYALFTHEPLVADGHCPYCQRTATFYRTAGTIPIMELDLRLNSSLPFVITCTRNRTSNPLLVQAQKSGHPKNRAVSFARRYS